MAKRNKHRKKNPKWHYGTAGEITWNVFNEKANRFANLLLSRGIQKGDKEIGRAHV